MTRLALHRFSANPGKILCLGAHSDDIEIGCGGTILRLLKELDSPEIWWIVFGADVTRKKEAERSARSFLEKGKDKNIIIRNFKDGFFPFKGTQIKSFMEKMKKSYTPDIVFSHYRYDLHQDHRFISDVTYQTFREQVIFEYEVLKYDGDIKSPNYYFHLDKEICEKKTATILRYFRSQSSKDWFTKDAFTSVLRIRGVESRSPSGFAEGFFCRKIAV